MKALAKVPLLWAQIANSSRKGSNSRFEYVAISLVLALSTLLYSSTLYPGIGGRINYGDSVKWQFLWAVDGTPHSTGYPLFSMITKLFGELLVFIEPYLRISVISVVFGVLALIPVYLITRQLTSIIFLRISAPLLLALSSTYWSESTEPEVYTLSVFTLTFSTWLLLCFVRGKGIGFLVASLTVYAVSFGNHLTAAMLIPAYIYAVLSNSRREKALRAVLVMLPILAVLSIGQYAYIYHLSHKGGPYLEYIGKNATLWKLLDYATGGQFRGELGSSLLSPGTLAEHVLKSLYIFHRDLGLPLLLVAAYSLWSILVLSFKSITRLGMDIASGRKVSDADMSHNAKTVLFLAVAFQILYDLSYPIGDIHTYFLSIYSLLIPLSMSSIDDFISSKGSGDIKSLKKIAIFAILGTLSVQFAYGFKVNRVKENPIQSTAERIFKKVPSSSLLFIGMDEDYPLHEALWYYSALGMPEKSIRIKKDETNGYTIKKARDGFLLVKPAGRGSEFIEHFGQNDSC